MVEKEVVIEEITETKTKEKETETKTKEIKEDFKKVIPTVNIQYWTWILEKWKEVKVPVEFYERIKHLIK